MKLREIKFRAWLTELEHMIPSNQILGFISEPINEELEHDIILKYSSVPINQDGYIVKEENSDFYRLMQYTGMHDKDGKDIYEGDILKISDDVNAPVGFNEKTGAFCCEHDNKKTDHLFASHMSEVIGNIYENPELLK